MNHPLCNARGETQSQAEYASLNNLDIQGAGKNKNM